MRGLVCSLLAGPRQRSHSLDSPRYTASKRGTAQRTCLPSLSRNRVHRDVV
jgi:hypothetical protein